MAEWDAKITITAENRASGVFAGVAEEAQSAGNAATEAVDALRARLAANFEQIQAKFGEGFKFDLKGFDNLQQASDAAFAKMAQAAQGWFDATRTPLEQFGRKQQELGDLLRNGAIDAETHRRAMEKVKGEYLGALSPAERFRVQSEELTAALKRGEIGAKEYKQRIAALSDEMKRAEGAANPLAAALGRVGSLFQGLGLAVGFGSLLKTADEMQVLHGQIQQVSGSTAEYATAQRELLAIANRTGASFDATASLYVKSTRALQDLGYSQKEMLTFTEALNNAMTVGGVSAENQASALMQLGQALGSGVLQGDEFKSIAEAAPGLLDIVAEHVGVTRAELKKLGSEGKLTAEVIMSAVSGAAGDLAEKAAKMPVTLGNALTVLRNNWNDFVHRLMNSTGVMQVVARFVRMIAENLHIVIPAVLALGAGFLVTLVPGIVAATTSMLAFNVALLANPIGLVAAAIVGLVAMVAAFGDEIKIFGDDFTTLTDVVAAAFDIIGGVVWGFLEGSG